MQRCATSCGGVLAQVLSGLPVCEGMKPKPWHRQHKAAGIPTVWSKWMVGKRFGSHSSLSLFETRRKPCCSAGMQSKTSSPVVLRMEAAKGRLTTVACSTKAPVCLTVVAKQRLLNSMVQHAQSAESKMEGPQPAALQQST